MAFSRFGAYVMTMLSPPIWRDSGAIAGRIWGQIPKENTLRPLTHPQEGSKQLCPVRLGIARGA